MKQSPLPIYKNFSHSKVAHRQEKSKHISHVSSAESTTVALVPAQGIGSGRGINYKPITRLKLGRVVLEVLITVYRKGAPKSVHIIILPYLHEVYAVRHYYIVF